MVKVGQTVQYFEFPGAQPEAALVLQVDHSPAKLKVVLLVFPVGQPPKQQWNVPHGASLGENDRSWYWLPV